MTREEAKKFLPIIQAYAEGKDIEYYNTYCKKWKLAGGPTFDINCNYRIKPKSEYRPFDNGDECLEEMKKHEPFGWIKLDGVYRSIASVQEYYLHIDTEVRHFNTLFKYATFMDGTPFGIKEE